MSKILVVILGVSFFLSCHIGISEEIASPCYYKYLDSDSIPNWAYKDSGFLPLELDSLNLSSDLIKIFYSSFDLTSNDKRSLLIIMDGASQFKCKLKTTGEIDSFEKVTKIRSKQIYKLVQLILKEKNRFIERYCLIEGGSEGALVLMKGDTNTVEYFYYSEGYECDILGENNKTKTAALLVKLIKGL